MGPTYLWLVSDRVKITAFVIMVLLCFLLGCRPQATAPKKPEPKSAASVLVKLGSGRIARIDVLPVFASPADDAIGQERLAVFVAVDGQQVTYSKAFDIPK